MKVMRMKYTLLGLPANLRRYSRVNHDMQTDSINASFGLSKGFPVEQCSSSPYFHWKKQLTSEVGVLEGVHSVQAHPHCWDHHEHHAGQKLLLVCKKLIQPNVRHPFCCRRGVRLFDQVPKVFLVPGPPSQVSRCAIWIFSFVHQRMKKSSFFQQGVKAHRWFAEPPNAKVLDVVQDQLARLYIKNIK